MYEYLVLFVFYPPLGVEKYRSVIILTPHSLPRHFIHVICIRILGRESRQRKTVRPDYNPFYEPPRALLRVLRCPHNVVRSKMWVDRE